MEEITIPPQTKKNSTKIAAGIVLTFGVIISLFMCLFGVGTLLAGRSAAKMSILDFFMKDFWFVLGISLVPLLILGLLAYLIFKKDSWKYIFLALLLSFFIPTGGVIAIFNPLYLLFGFEF